MRRALLAVTGLLGLVKLVTVSAGDTEIAVLPLEHQPVQVIQQMSPENARPAHSTYDQRRFGFSYEKRPGNDTSPGLIHTPNSLDQAPAVRLASISFTAPFSR